jgi:uncharacterized protein
MDYSVSSMSERLSHFMYRVYGIMALALTLTAVTAYFIATTPAVFNAIFGRPALAIGLLVAQLLLAVVFSFFLMRLSLPIATAIFITYAILLGLTLSTIFVVYTAGSIYLAFFATAGMFATMAIYGYITKADLTTIGNLAFMCLIGLIIAMTVNIFLKSTRFDYIISAIGILIFTALIAYDSQKIKQLGMQLFADHQTMGKVALFGAFSLYLDFVNLFMYILSFTGKRRD